MRLFVLWSLIFVVVHVSAQDEATSISLDGEESEYTCRPEDDVCVNGGTCMQKRGTRVCVCSASYTGTRCQYAIGTAEDRADLEARLDNMEQQLESTIYNAMREIEQNMGRYMYQILATMGTAMNHMPAYNDPLNPRPVRENLFAHLSDLMDEDETDETEEENIDYAQFLQQMQQGGDTGLQMPCFGSNCGSSGSSNPRPGSGYGPYYAQYQLQNGLHQWSWPTADADLHGRARGPTTLAGASQVGGRGVDQPIDVGSSRRSRSRRHHHHTNQPTAGQSIMGARTGRARRSAAAARTGDELAE